MKTERFIAARCCEGILASGNGTNHNPYIVTRTSDEHDVMQYLGKEFMGQSLVHNGDQQLDVIQCADGTEMWFDITDAYNKLAEDFGGGDK